MSVRLLQHPSDAELEQIVQFSIQAYGDDPTIRSMTGNRPELRAAFFRSMLKAGTLEGQIYIVELENKDIVSVGLWFGPGMEVMKTVGQRALGWNAFWDSLTPDTRDWWAYLNKTTDGMVDDSVGKEPLLDSWYANLIATHPSHQGKGYASAMLRTVCERGNAEGKLVALGTQNEKNANWYRSLGFQIIGQVEVKSDLGGFPAYLLSRKPETTLVHGST
ncbi:hypothetical protein HGRIS_006067 [Hohenbuehelia grisea]|uniref:N-acetyltransferase domain-containing protein n=1 Tax=Hohenbuehelia grisea TaxID=104357 RepID=A0ABR3JYU3_9AGAR